MSEPAPRQETVWFRAGDQHWLNFKRVPPAAGAPDMGPVILVHGTGVRANLFNPPTRVTLPAMLSAAGFDVWMLNWRSSIDLRPIQWNLDDAAVLDFPAAVEVILQETKKTSLKAIVHCQGSCAFLMSMVAGKLPEVTTVVANSSGLHPLVPWITRLKVPIAMTVFGRVGGFNPQHGIHAPTFSAKVIRWLVRATHHECDNAVCKYASFVYGFGFPTMWNHDNLDAATHDWLAGEFGYAPIKLFKQIRRCIGKGRLVAMGGYPPEVLPREFALEGHPPKTTATFHFVTGAENRCFRPAAMEATAEYFNEYSTADQHSFHEFPGYGHMDVFIGRNASEDVFPYLIDKLSG